MQKIPNSGELYRHFKGNLYQVLVIATHSETKEPLVIYQALYGDFRVYARPLEMFLSLVDSQKYPDSKQTYRFELVEREEIQIEEKKAEQKQIEEDKECSQDLLQSREVNQELIRFLDAETCREKIEILQELRKDMNKRLLDNIAASLDIILEEESLEAMFDRILNYLQTRAKFERR